MLIRAKIFWLSSRIEDRRRFLSNSNLKIDFLYCCWIVMTIDGKYIFSEWRQYRKKKIFLKIYSTTHQQKMFLIFVQIEQKCQKLQYCENSYYYFVQFIFLNIKFESLKFVNCKWYFLKLKRVFVDTNSFREHFLSSKIQK